MDLTPILDGLNARQREAVTAPPGNLLVVAGAGSGKTRVLVHRIAWLVAAEGASPHGILAVTFTNKAAAEMRGRTEALVGARAMWVGTFHGIAHRLLRLHWREAGLAENFQIIDSDDQLRLVKRVLRSMDLDEKRWPPKQAVAFINAAKEAGRRAAEVRDDGDYLKETQKRIYTAYEALCQQGGVVDFAELLLRCHELWLTKPALLEHYQRRFRHILVDEFQDTNTIQYASLRVLAGAASHVMAVGDDDQSIYGWRGAKMENIHRFPDHFAATRVIRLEQNYRSTGTILEAANGLIAKNAERLGKSLWTAAGAGDPVLVYEGYNEVEEARFVAERALAWIDGGGSADEIAVLYRSNAQSRALEEAFLRADIAYRIYGGLRFFERSEIKNALAYMRLVSQPHADVAFERVINLPPRGIGGKTVDAVRTLARARGVSLWQAVKEGIHAGRFDGRMAKALAGFVGLIEALAAAAGRLTLREVAERCIGESGLLAHHGKEPGERGLARKENLEELVAACRRFEADRMFPLDPRGAAAEEEAGMASTLADFLDQAALEAGEYQAEGGAAVQMMTLHSAKGLEFPLVFITGMEEGLFPSRMAAEAPARIEEERRLAYVGITRAMRQLYLSRAEVRWLRGTESYNPPSRFLDEIPAAALQSVRMGGAIARRPSGNGAAAAGGEAALRLGARVRHAKFGEGVVLTAEGSGERARIQVRFAAGAQVKWLMLGYANLEVLE